MFGIRFMPTNGFSMPRTPMYRECTHIRLRIATDRVLTANLCDYGLWYVALILTSSLALRLFVCKEKTGAERITVAGDNFFRIGHS